MRLSLGRDALLIGLAVALFLPGCSRDEDLSGVYTGNVRASAQGVSLTVPVRVTLSQSGSSLGGTFEASNANGTTARGTVGGSVNGSAVSLGFTPTTAGDCPAQLSGTRADKSITGTAQINCPGQAAVPGTFDLTKQ